MSDPQPLEPQDAFAQLGRIKLAETNLDGVLDTIARLAKLTIPSADEVSVTLMPGKRPRTAAFTSDLALACDERQYEVGHGPCLDASVTATILVVPDMSRETRWPDYTPRVVDAGVRSSVSIGLPVHESTVGALNLYATRAYAFDHDAVAIGQEFAGYAAAALTNVHIYGEQTTLAQQLRAAMESRAVIEQAKGIIMGSRRCSPDEAFTILSKLSQDTNRKLRDVAAALVASANE